MRRYLPQLDGLRAVAVLLVVGTHTGVIPGGYVGVDIFFVLSGYLITNILLSERRAGQWDVSGFYQRRLRRLYPALLVMLLLTIPLDGQFLPGGTGHRIGVVVAAATYTADFVYAAHADVAGALGHLWSLAVEEQFYLLWPFAIPYVLRHRRAGIAGVALVTAGTLALLLTGPQYPMLYTLYARGGVLLIGCLLALLSQTVGLDSRLGALFAAALAAVVCFVAPDTQAAAAASILTGFASAGLLASLRAGGALVSALSWTPLVWLGKRSYAVYLWHLPVVGLLTRERFASGDLDFPRFGGQPSACDLG